MKWVMVFGSSGGSASAAVPGAPAVVRLGVEAALVEGRLISGDVDLTFSSTGSAVPQVSAGKLTLLAVCSPKRLPNLPKVPAVAETLPGYEIATWYGLAGPAKLPREIVARLNSEVQAILKQPDVAKRLQDLDAEVSSGSPESFAAFWKKEIEKYGRIIADAKIQA